MAKYLKDFPKLARDFSFVAHFPAQNFVLHAIDQGMDNFQKLSCIKVLLEKLVSTGFDSLLRIKDGSN